LPRASGIRRAEVWSFLAEDTVAVLDRLRMDAV
jgi:hypothetical protein